MAKRQSCKNRIEELITLGFDKTSKSPGAIRIGCSQCSPSVINGIPCHERGCPNKPSECRECGCIVPPGHRYCGDCI